MEEYTIITKIYFEKKYTKLLQKNKNLEKKIVEAFLLLRINPFDQKLKTHKVTSKNFGSKWSSSITGDIRIIWDFDNEKIRVLLVVDIGGHSGNKKIYK